MTLTLASILPRRSRSKADPADILFEDYSTRIARYTPSDSPVFNTETDFLNALSRQPGRTAPFAVLLDSRGKQLSSEELAQHLGRWRDTGTQRLVFAIGPADGWSAAARERADLLLSFGRITLPHQLARVVLAEQVYRALTILAGHPYHSGH
jgi:23S rRNA (pseudouridine1915-N3)-methyltransferase